MINKKGFTITELLAVIAIIAILSVAAMSGYSAMSNNSKKKSLEQKVLQIETAAEKYAKDVNLHNTETISTNKLVVMGYLTPDSTTEAGLASINNPVNNENMVCNLITINVVDDNYKATFVKEKKDCSIARNEINDTNVDIKVVEYHNTSVDRIVPNFGTDSSKEYDWVNDDVLINVSSETYESQSRSITYEYGGNVIEKSIADGIKATNPSDSTTPDQDKIYNEIVIKDIGSIFENVVYITYNLKDGGTKSVDVLIRIDKEKPVGYSVISNDTTTASNRKANIFLDDGTGSGINGFYYSMSKEIDANTAFIGKNKKSGEAGIMKAKLVQTNDVKKLVTGGEIEMPRGTYYAMPVDVAGNIGDPIVMDVTNFDPSDLSCDITVRDLSGADITKNNTWYNQSIVLRAESVNPVGDYGAKYNFLKNKTSLDVNDLKLNVPPNNKMIADIKEENEMNEIDYAAGLIGMSTNNNTDETKRYCHIKVGIDKTRPTVKVTANDASTWAKQHEIKVEITDDRSGFTANASGKTSFTYGWSTSPTEAPTETNRTTVEATLSNGNKKATKTMTIGSMTGEYYFWIIGSSVKDKAENNLLDYTHATVFKFDNTAPGCTNSGDSTDWQKEKRIIKYGCSDEHSKCKANQGGQKEFTTTTKTAKIDAYVIEDNVGNKRECPARTANVYVDTTKPTCTHSGDTASWSTSDVTLYYGCSDDHSGCNPSYSGGSQLYSSSGATVTVPAYTIRDNVGNETSCPARTAKVYIDKVAPKCTESGDSTAWTKNDRTLNYGCEDPGGSGCDPNNKGGSKEFKTTTKTSTIAAYTIKDKVGNETNCPAKSRNVYVDKTGPSCTESGDSTTWTKENRTLYYGCRDDQSGCDGKNKGGSQEFKTTTKTSTIAAYKIKDKVGNETNCPAKERNVYVDKTAPSCTNSGDSTDWTKENRTLYFGCKDNQSGCDDNYKGSSQDFTTTTKTSTIAAYKIKDKVGNETNCPAKKRNVYVDKTGPSCTESGDSTTWTKENRTLVYGCRDDQSGCDDKNKGSSKDFTTTTKTSTIAAYKIKDKVGNETNCPAKKRNVYVDKTAPKCTNSGDSTDWTKDDRTIYYGCNDEHSKCDSSFSGGNSLFSTTTITSKISSYTIMDKAGNSVSCNARTANVYVDKTKPTVSSISVSSRNSKYHTTSVNIGVKGSDANSGVSKACVSTSSDVSKCSWRNFDGDDNYENISVASSYNGDTITIYAWIKDVAGNISDVKTASYTVYSNCTTTTNDGSYTCGKYGNCSLTCGSGLQYATKTQKKKDAYTGVACQAVETPSGCSRTCNTQDCCSSTSNGDVIASWWTGCNVTCGSGTNYLIYRYNKKSVFNGAVCDGYEDVAVDSAACYAGPCGVQQTYSGSYSGAVDNTTVVFYVGDKFIGETGVSASYLSSGYLGACSYAYGYLSCPITGIAGVRSTTDDRCALANSTTTGEAFYYGGDCYVHAGHSPRFTGNDFTCGTRTEPKIPGTGNHCPAEAPTSGHVHCVTGDNCIQAEKHKDGNKYRCWCWSRGEAVSHYVYDTSYTLVYYTTP